MSEITTVGNVLVNEALPEQYRVPVHNFDKKSIQKLLTSLADEHPEKYKDVLSGLDKVGRKAVFTEGVSVSLTALLPPKSREELLKPVREQLRNIVDDDTIDSDERRKRIIDLVLPLASKLQDVVMEESIKEDNPFAFQISTGARGKKSDLNSLRGADLLVADPSNRLLPVPILHSYSEGLSPAEYFATTYGQRKGMLDVKLSTAQAGYLAKRLTNGAHRIIVSKETPDPTRLPTGLPVAVDDRDNIGAVLAADVGPYKAGTLITDKVLSEIKDLGQDEILVHSPLTEISADGGVSRYAAGQREKRGLSPIGDYVGTAAAQASGEKVSQGTLSSKHSAGIATRRTLSGLDYINRLVEAPEHFPEAGPLAEVDGVVSEVKKAPQGGHYVTVGKQQHYLHPEIEPVVKVGDEVEAGDDLSDGVPHPTQLIKYRGMGEARRVYLDLFRKAMQESGHEVNRRNHEVLVAGMLNWAKVTDPDGIGDNISDDVVPYGVLASGYKPRPTAKQFKPTAAVGKYLEEPVLHYSPGTRVTKRVAKYLDKWKIGDVYANDEPPGFEPEFVRSVHSVSHDPDWKTRLAGFYTTGAFTEALHRGRSSDQAGTSYLSTWSDPANPPPSHASTTPKPY